MGKYGARQRFLTYFSAMARTVARVSGLNNKRVGGRSNGSSATCQQRNVNMMCRTGDGEGRPNQADRPRFPATRQGLQAGQDRWVGRCIATTRFVVSARH